MSYIQFSKDLNEHGFSYEQQMVLFARVTSEKLLLWYLAYLEQDKCHHLTIAEHLSKIYQQHDLEVRLGSSLPNAVYFYNPVVGGFTLTIPSYVRPMMITEVGPVPHAMTESKLLGILDAARYSEGSVNRFYHDTLTTLARKTPDYDQTLAALLPNHPLEVTLQDSEDIIEVLVYRTDETDSDVLTVVKDFL